MLKIKNNSFNKNLEGKELNKCNLRPLSITFHKDVVQGFIYTKNVNKIHTFYDERLLRTLSIVYCAIKHRQHDSNQLPTPHNSYIMKPKK